MSVCVLFRAGSCAIDLKTESVLALNKKNESELEISDFYLVTKKFRSESQLHMLRPLADLAHTVH